MDKIRVLLANYPIMLPEAIKQLMTEQGDMEVVGDCRGPMRILRETGRTKADAVILTQEGNHEPALCGQLLAVYPDLTVMCITGNREHVYVERLSSCRQEMRTSQVRDIAELLRDMVRNQNGTQGI